MAQTAAATAPPETRSYRWLAAALVRLESNGGSLVAGIQIGETIRLKGLQTLVPAGARCASACAMAWLGGTQRFMGPGAQIGLHLAYNAKSGQGTGVALLRVEPGEAGEGVEELILFTAALRCWCWSARCT